MGLQVPDYCVDEVADHALALVLTLLRGIVVLDRDVRAGGWDWQGAGELKRIRGTRLGVVGLGRTGRALVERARALGFEVWGSDRRSRREGRRSGARPAPLRELLAACHAVSLHVALSPETEGLLGEEELALMPDGAVLVDTARPQLVDLDALRRELESGRLGGAALDVIPVEPPTADHPAPAWPRLVVTPHVAWYSAQAEEACVTRTGSLGSRCARGPRAGRSGEPAVIALVTGGGTGIGRATALELGRSGASVVVCGRRPEPLEETRAAVEELGADCWLCPPTSASRSRSKHSSTPLSSASGGSMFSSTTPGASSSRRGDLAQSWRAVHRLAVDAAWDVTRAVATRSMIPNRGGVVVFVGFSPRRGIPGFAHAAAARAAVENLAAGLAGEWSRFGIGRSASRPARSLPRGSRATVPSRSRSGRRRFRGSTGDARRGRRGHRLPGLAGGFLRHRNDRRRRRRRRRLGSRRAAATGGVAVPTVARLSTTPVKSLLLLHHPDEIVLEPFGVAEDRRFYLIREDGRLLAGLHRPARARSCRLGARSDRLRLAFPEGEIVEDDVRLSEFSRTSGVIGSRGGRSRGPGPTRCRATRAEPFGSKTDVPAGGVDAEPLTLVSSESVAELARQAGLTGVDGRRFRMLLEIQGCAPHEEDTWRGRRFR